MLGMNGRPCSYGRARSRSVVALVAALAMIGAGSIHADRAAHAAGGPLMIDLGTLPGPPGSTSYALIVNSRGHVAGISTGLSPLSEHAFFWTAGHGMIDLGTLGGSWSYPTSMNDSDQVVGAAATPGGVGWHAFSWTPQGGMVDLGTFGGRISGAQAVNSSGVVVGDAQIPSNVTSHAFAWTSRTGMVDLGTIGGTSSAALWVDNSDQIVGQSSIAHDAAWHAFRWTLRGGMVDLGTLGGVNSSAPGCCPLPSQPAVNWRGRVVGESELAGTLVYHAFSWTARTGMVDLGTLPGGADSTANAINAHGRVVGWAGSHAFMWTAARGMMDLGTLGGPSSQAVALNDEDEVVGQSIPRGDVAEHAFLWTPENGMMDLGTLGGDASGASWVTESGLIAGFAETPTGLSHAVLWITRPSESLIPMTKVTHAATASGGSRPSGSKGGRPNLNEQLLGPAAGLWQPGAEQQAHVP